MGLKGFFKMLFKGSSEIKALRGEVSALRGELNAARAGSLSKSEAVVLEKGLNGGKAAQAAAEGDAVVVAAKAVKGKASSTILGGQSYCLSGLEVGKSLKANNVYRSTVDDVIQIGNTRLSLSDPRIVKALEKKGMDGQITIGRSSSCDVVLKDATVSGEHLVIKAKCPGSKRLYIEDLNSTNGTRVIKTNPYSQADRAKDAQKGKEYIEGLAGKSKAASMVSPDKSISAGNGTAAVPYDSNCRMIKHKAKKGEQLFGADYILSAKSRLNIGGHEIKLSDPIIKQALESKGTITIGRSSSCDVVVNQSTVSGIHLSLTQMPDGRVLIKDLGSTNGTTFIK